MLGTGWLGLPLSSHLILKGFRVKGSMRSKERCASLEAEGIDSFIIDLAQGVVDLGFFAADILIINIPFKGVSEFLALIDVIEQSAIKHVIFISSTSVYGNKIGALSEVDYDYLIPCALLEIENLLRLNCHFSTTVVRFGGLIGYHRNPAFFFKNNRLIQKPESCVNLIHRDDCIQIIALIIERNVWDQTYNACADTHPTKRVFYSYVARLSGFPLPLFSDDVDTSCKIISNTKIKQDLAYGFEYPDLLDLNINLF